MNYAGLGIGRKKKKTALTVAAVVVAAVFLVIYFIGLTLGSDSEARVAISEAIEENARLRQELVEKDLRINELTERINELENTQTDTQVPEESEEEVSPRQGSPRE